MNAILISIPIAFALAALGFVTLVYMIMKGDFDDIESAKYRIFFDEDEDKK
ncbi:MAG: cbb3-type cytochrome oxidase assembly protein CcoS [Leptospiraceae bacterium]|nr:cbb3-type cytochrome oxidase assembly protein CcoS [Leptospiraceae bacterium]